jgi:hypothetical protein
LSKTEIPVVYKDIIDTYIQKRVIIKYTFEKYMTNNIILDYNLLKQIIYQLIKENKFPE